MCSVLVVKCIRSFYGSSVAICWLVDPSAVSLKNGKRTCELKDCFELKKYSGFIICCELANGWRSNCYTCL